MNDRNYGIDLLRILSMMGIIILHVLGHGGILDNLDFLSVKYAILWFVEISVFCAVNCYCLISGYVGYGKKFNGGNLLYLCIQACFYTVVITLLFLFWGDCNDNIGFSMIVEAAFPFAFNVYWYFSAYFSMFFFVPFLNYLLENLEVVQCKKLIYTILIVYSIIPTIFNNDMGNIDDGYSALWLAFMYLIGGYIKKCNIAGKKSQYVWGYIMCVIITWLGKFSIEIISNYIWGEPHGGALLISNTSPTIIFAAIFLLLIFSRLHIKKSMIKVIRFFAPLTFGIYLIHEEPLIRTRFIENAFIDYVKCNVIQCVVGVFFTSICIFIFCSLIDKLRLLFFEKVGIKEKCVLGWNKMSLLFKISN